jgi:hypothetical protein
MTVLRAARSSRRRSTRAPSAIDRPVSACGTGPPAAEGPCPTACFGLAVAQPLFGSLFRPPPAALRTRPRVRALDAPVLPDVRLGARRTSGVLSHPPRERPLISAICDGETRLISEVHRSGTSSPAEGLGGALDDGARRDRRHGRRAGLWAPGWCSTTRGSISRNPRIIARRCSRPPCPRS